MIGGLIRVYVVMYNIHPQPTSNPASEAGLLATLRKKRSFLFVDDDAATSDALFGTFIVGVAYLIIIDNPGSGFVPDFD